jgi:hypothetical protein
LLRQQLPALCKSWLDHLAVRRLARTVDSSTVSLEANKII